jgi:hypothetical protein
VAFPAVGIIGNTGVGIIDARSIGWILMGPVVGLFLGIADNSFLPNSFKGRGASRLEQCFFESVALVRFNHAEACRTSDALFSQATNSFLEFSFHGFSQRLRGQA